MGDVAIQFEHVGKLYELGSIGTGSAARDLTRWWHTRVLRREDPYLRLGETNDRATRGSGRHVWALQDVSLDIRQGDTVGIIGRNGAGKSTLLKLLSRVTSPTTGTIRANGRIASLLEVGTGFHPEMTGRENVYMNGAIMGMTRREIAMRMADIVDFAGVARYIDTPIKRYSSGMMVRLGFAVAAFLEPEILVVDEVLAVGDADFQKKAIGKMQDVAKGSGRTVLFVSHNMAAVQALCRQGVVLENGTLGYSGSVAGAVEHYIRSGVETSGRIAARIGELKPGIEIHSIKVNGSEECRQTIGSQRGTIDVDIEGSCTFESYLNLLFRIKTKTGVALAKFYPNESTGYAERYPAGEFHVHESIALPEILSEGVYDCDIFLVHHQVQAYMKAYDCLELTFQGRTQQYGQIGHASLSGFLGLQRATENPGGR